MLWIWYTLRNGSLSSESTISDEFFLRKQSTISFEVDSLQFKSLASLFVFSTEDSLEKAQLHKLDPDWAIAPLNKPLQ